MPAATHPSRRTWLLQASTATLAALTASAWAVSPTPSAPATRPLIEVWKDPNCGCCQDWIAHMEQNGFAVKVHNTGNNAIRTRLGLPQKLGSCHTARVQGYVLEGHVPATEVQRLLHTRPRALGLAVPGMPVGSPGMDGAVYAGRRDPYDVLLVRLDGTTEVFRRYA